MRHVSSVAYQRISVVFDDFTFCLGVVCVVPDHCHVAGELAEFDVLLCQEVQE